MQQIFVKDIKDSTFNTDVLAKLKKEHILRQCMCTMPRILAYIHSMYQKRAI